MGSAPCATSFRVPAKQWISLRVCACDLRARGPPQTNCVEALSCSNECDLDGRDFPRTRVRHRTARAHPCGSLRCRSLPDHSQRRQVQPPQRWRLASIATCDATKNATHMVQHVTHDVTALPSSDTCPRRSPRVHRRSGRLRAPRAVVRLSARHRRVQNDGALPQHQRNHHRCSATAAAAPKILVPTRKNVPGRTGWRWFKPPRRTAPGKNATPA